MRRAYLCNSLGNSSVVVVITMKAMLYLIGRTHTLFDIPLYVQCSYDSSALHFYTCHHRHVFLVLHTQLRDSGDLQTEATILSIRSRRGLNVNINLHCKQMSEAEGSFIFTVAATLSSSTSRCCLCARYNEDRNTFGRVNAEACRSTVSKHILLTLQGNHSSIPFNGVMEATA